MRESGRARAGRGARSRWRWTGTVLVAALAVGTLAACRDSGSPQAVQTDSDRLGDENFSFFRGVDTVEQNLTQALLKHDRNAFLAAFSGPARTAAQQWWTNQDRIGFNVGVASVTPGDRSVRPRNGVATLDVEVSLATHAAVDPTDDEGKPGVAGWKYTLTLQTSSRTKPPTVVKMTPATGPAPWDVGPLYVARAGNVIVAGPAAERATVDRYVGYAKAASDWIYAFARRNHQGLIADQHGFVVFVTADKNLRNRWFHAVGTKQKGWIPDAAGYEVPLAQPPSLSGGDRVGHLVLGGERIVVGPVSDAHQAERTLVHEMAHALIEPFGGGFSPSRPPLWTVEGFARWVDTIFDTHRPDGKGTFAGGTVADLQAAIRSGFFTGAPPADSVFYQGSVQQGNYAYDLGASGFEYVTETYGPTTAIKAAMYAYSQGGSAFARVVGSDNSHGDVISVTFLDEGAVIAAWARWLRANY